MKALHAKIRQLAMENVSWKARSVSWACGAQKMIERAYALPVVPQAELLELSRASVYYLPQLVLMRRIDVLHLKQNPKWSAQTSVNP